MAGEEFIAKIEGHGAIHVDWNKNNAQLKVFEGERLFEGMLVNRTAEESHWITPRICGVCPVAHNLAALSACENAFKISINQTTVLLRKLMIVGQMIQSHFLHLFFLALPDYIGIDRGTELNKKDPSSFKMAMELKKVADEIVRLVAGRNVHPTTTTIGGFHKVPGAKPLRDLLETMNQTRQAALKTVKLFSNLDYPKLKVDLELVSQKNGKIFSNKDASLAEDGESRRDDSLIGDYKKDIEEEVKNYSTAKFGFYKKRAIMVGALARIYHSEIGEGVEEAGLPLGSPASKNSGLDYSNPFHNNLAQAVEIYLYHEQARLIIEELLKNKLDDSVATRQNSDSDSFVGIGAVEAPRGGLYHEFHFSPTSSGVNNSIITYANIITPTVQNLTSIEKSANALLEQYQNESAEKKQQLLEMLVRAYDPCITCAVH